MKTNPHPTSHIPPSHESSNPPIHQSTARPRRGPQFDRRTTWERLSLIDEWIASGTYPSTGLMARKLGVTARTVTRDLEFMKKTRKLPIQYDERRYGFYYAKDTRGFPKAPITQAGIFAIMVAHKSVAQYHGTPFEKPLRAAFQQLTGQLDNRQLHSIANLGDVLSFRPFAPEDSDLRMFKTVTKALAERRELQFRYRNWGDKRVIPRRLQPYHLVCFDTRWYMVGYDLAQRAVRTFALSRLCQPQLLKRRFTRPRRFDPDDYFKGSLGVMKGESDKTYEVVIEFDACGTDLIRGRRWHSSQQFIEDVPNRRSRLTMQLSSLEEIERAVLSWGTHATVLAPACLRQRLLSIATELASRYSASSSSSFSFSSSNPNQAPSNPEPGPSTHATGSDAESHLCE